MDYSKIMYVAVTGDTMYGVNTANRPTQYKSGLDYDTELAGSVTIIFRWRTKTAKTLRYGRFWVPDIRENVTLRVQPLHHVRYILLSWRGGVASASSIDFGEQGTQWCHT